MLVCTGFVMLFRVLAEARDVTCMSSASSICFLGMISSLNQFLISRKNAMASVSECLYLFCICMFSSREILKVEIRNTSPYNRYIR